MSKIGIKITLMTLCSLLWLCSAAHALFWQDSALVTINDESFSRQNFLDWWQEWQEPDMELPETPDDFINWILLSNEAEQMQLYDEEQFKQKVHTFLKVRSLMLLKQEEIDSKVLVTDDEVAAVYHQDYTPVLKLRSIELETPEQCDKFLTAAGQGLSAEEIIADPALNLDQVKLCGSILQRPNQLPPRIRALYEQDTQARFLPAYSYEDRWFILEVLQKDPGNDDDLAMVAENILYSLKKKKQQELTGQLNTRLMKKYQVQLDEALFSRIHVDGPEADVADAAVITFPDLTITGQILYDNAINHYRRFGGKDIKNISFEDIVRRVANDIVAQTLTTMEALDRHYETKPPFQSVYYFYQRHRLIRGLEHKLIKPQISVSDDELEQYYNTHHDEFAYPLRVRYASVETRNEKMALKLRDELRKGGDFYQVLSPLSPEGIATKTTPVPHLVPEMQALVSTLQPGQCDMLQVDDYFHFIRLVESPRIDYMPFEQIKDSLRAQLEDQKFKEKRAELIARLRQRTNISVNQRQWQRCINELKGQ
nr:peptidylprolyl isomerase [uncultured Desulfuromonas sp.]